MICFHHNDLDGQCSAAIVHKYFSKHPPPGDSKESLRYVEIDYTEQFPYELIYADELIVIVDFSPNDPDGFKRLLEFTHNIIWIDHHGTAIDKHKAYIDRVNAEALKLGNYPIIKGVQIEGDKAACELTWDYFYPDQEPPRMVQFIGDYDTWTFKYGNETRLTQLGCKLHNTSVTSNVWDYWLESCYVPHSELQEGAIIQTFQKHQNKKLIRENSYTIIFEGYKTICCNTQGNSQLFDSVLDQDFDIHMSYHYTNQQNWRFTIYSPREDINVSEIAVRYGGGGHPFAAGFVTDEFPDFLKP